VTFAEDLAMSVPLMDPNFYIGDPYPALARLRREAPVFWYEPGGFWALSTLSDIRHVSTHSELFTIERGHHFMHKLHPELITANVPPGAENLLATDPPRQADFRRLINKSFTPRAVAPAATRIRELVRERLGEIADTGAADFVEQVSMPIPIDVVAELLGIPREHQADFRRWSDALMANFDTPPDSPKYAHQAQLARQLFSYLDEALVERRTSPRGDFLSVIAQLNFEGKPLAKPTQNKLAVLLLTAGSATTREAMTGGVWALAQYKDQWRRLRDDRSAISTALDEIVRWHPPVLSFGRTAKADTVIRDQKITAGEFVAMLYLSANRDEEAWDRADEFDVTRQPRPMHVAYGSGEHFCLGANLAALEIRILLEEMVETFSDLDIVGDPVRRPSVATNSITRLPVVLTRR
jgi:cytochrome P450